MNATVLSIGTELLFGQIVNTNAAYISQKLQLLGINVMYHYTVGDNPDRFRETLKNAMSDTDLIITTGGLGPTQDDLTKEIISESMGEKLIFHQPTMDNLNKLFIKYNREMTENNLKQAYVPENATVFTNDSGTAPGFALEKNGKTIIAMPGPPREMKYMFETYVYSYLENKSDGFLRYKLLRMFGIGESALEAKVEKLIDAQTDPTLATYAKEGEVSLRIASRRKSAEEANEAVNSMIKKVRELVGEYIFSEDDEDLNSVVGKRLIKDNITIASAESCTGGMFGKTLTDVPGISAVYYGGFITYTNDAKIKEIGVSKETLDEYGAVSPETAAEMAKGVIEATGSDIGVSVTGIAGPGGGSDEKPVGLCYICVSYKGEEYVRKISGRDRGRIWNRSFFCLNMYNLINDVLNGKDKEYEGYQTNPNK